MKTIPEVERRQFLEATCGSAERAEPTSLSLSAAPILPLLDYLHRVEEFGRLFPKPMHPPAEGDHWLL